MDNRSIVDQYVNAMTQQDWATIAELGHPDKVVTYPQSGERFRGCDVYVAMLQNYPGGLDDGELVMTQAHKPPKQQVHVVTSPIGAPTITVSGGGDTFFFEGLVDYPNGDTYHTVGFLKVRDGLIGDETWYFGRPFEPPEWRAQYVESESSS